MIRLCMAILALATAAGPACDEKKEAPPSEAAQRPDASKGRLVKRPPPPKAAPEAASTVEKPKPFAWDLGRDPVALDVNGKVYLLDWTAGGSDPGRSLLKAGTSLQHAHQLVVLDSGTHVIIGLPDGPSLFLGEHHNTMARFVVGRARALEEVARCGLWRRLLQGPPGLSSAIGDSMSVEPAERTCKGTRKAVSHWKIAVIRPDHTATSNADWYWSNGRAIDMAMRGMTAFDAFPWDVHRNMHHLAATPIFDDGGKVIGVLAGFDSTGSFVP